MRMKTTILAALLAAGLSGCGGGGGDDAPAVCRPTMANPDLCVVKAAVTTAAPAIFPRSITAGDCTTNIPFVFTGGEGPFTVYTSDNFGVPVSGALPLGLDSYFTASIHNPGSSPATVTVLDSKSRTATATIIIPSLRSSCPTNPLFQTIPASANMRNSEILAFQITVGPTPTSAPPYHKFTFCQPMAIPIPEVTTANSPVCDPTLATIVEDNSTSFKVQADPSKRGYTLLTVTSLTDQQNTNIPISVFPQPVSP